LKYKVQEAKISKHVLGAQLYTVRDFTKIIPDIAKILKKITDIGYTAVQISGFGHVNPKEVAKVCDDSALMGVLCLEPQNEK